MPSLFAQSELGDLIDKVEKGQRLDFDAGIRLANSQEILALGYMANLVRERKNGDQTYFIVDRPINYADISASFEEIETNITGTMVYGNQESKEDWINQLLELRTLQDQTEKFLTFSPRPFYFGNPKFGTMGVGNTTGFEDLKLLSISRILLDNVDHIKAFWVLLGPKLAQVSLGFGVDDLDGTIVEERVTAITGEDSSYSISKQALINLIQKGGRIAVERDSLYRVRKID